MCQRKRRDKRLNGDENTRQTTKSVKTKHDEVQKTLRRDTVLNDKRQS